MLIFDNAYKSLLQNYIVPLSEYQTKYNSLRKNNIKTSILNADFSNFTYDDSRKEITLSFTSDRLLPALLGDIWLCYIRSELQCNSAIQIKSLQPDFCPNWSIVSDYYGAFFDASTLLRLTMRGNIFIDAQMLSTIKKVSRAYLGYEVTVDQNCIYHIEKEPSTLDRYNLYLMPSRHQTHETVWVEVGKIIRNMRTQSLPKSDELTALNCIVNCLDNLGDTFPSQLRNTVNYQLLYGLNAVDKKILPANAFIMSSKWLDPVLENTIKKNSPEEQKIAAFKSYALYIHVLTYNLISEYLDMRGREFGIMSAINKHRESKLTNPSAIYTYR